MAAEDELKGKELKVELSRIALKVASKARRAKQADFSKLNTVIGLLNHAQGIADSEPSKARRLLSVSKNLIK